MVSGEVPTYQAIGAFALGHHAGRAKIVGGDILTNKNIENARSLLGRADVKVGDLRMRVGIGENKHMTDAAMSHHLHRSRVPFKVGVLVPPDGLPNAVIAHDKFLATNYL